MPRMMIFVGLLVALAAAPLAYAASTSGKFVLVIRSPPFGLVIDPSTSYQACATPAGTLLANLSVVNGNGNPVTYSLPAGTTDVAISGATLVVAPSGFVLSDCGKNIPYTITATQN
jgi:hypothetical protein